MGSTTSKLAAELQYTGRKVFSSALMKMERSERSKMRTLVEEVYTRLSITDPAITRTDILQLLAALGANFAINDPEFKGSS